MSSESENRCRVQREISGVEGIGSRKNSDEDKNSRNMKDSRIGCNK